MSLKEWKTVLINKLAAFLKPLDFARKGNVFNKSNGDLTYFIGIQSSQSSTSIRLKLTLNIEIASSVISAMDEISLPVKDQRHYTERIGFYLPDRGDKWWEIDSIESAEKIADEICSILNEYVIPHLDSIRTTTDLAQMWKDGGYYGLTEGQKKRYLSLIDKAKRN